jgi:predicted 2-oxoglutarate/Fe(II)-dependent dioxygenase YbiX
MHTRRLAFDLDNTVQELVGRHGRHGAKVRKLSNVCHNLIRHWAEL